MKRIEGTIQANKIWVVTEDSNDIVGRFTIMEVKGRGSRVIQQVRTGRGTSEVTEDFNAVATVSTNVNDSYVEKVSTAIADAAYTGKGGDGIVVVSNVESVLNIASKKSGSEAL